MKRISQLAKSLSAAALLCAALDAYSLTLGRLRGAVLLGQPLNVSVQIQAAQDEDVSSLCLNARVLYGDAQQAANQTSVAAQSGPDGSVVAQILVNAIVSEPVVTVELLAGCSQKTSRKYLVFADLASDGVADTAPVRPRVAAATDGADSGTVPKVSAWDVPAKPVAATPPKKGAVAVLAVPKELRVKPAVPKAKKPMAAESKLKLVPPVAAPDRQPELKVSSQLPSAPIEDLQKRVDAIAQWKSLTLTPEEVQKNDAKMQSLEADLKALQAVTLKNQQNVTLLTTSLEKAESERYANPLVYALVALLAGVLAVFAYVYSRAKNATSTDTPWWSRSEEQAPTATSAGPMQTAQDQLRPVPDVSPKTTVRAAALPEKSGNPNVIDVDIALGESVFSGLVEADKLAAANKPASEVKRADKRDFSPSGSATLRAINTREMLDVRQQADFFLALGQHDEAVKVLENSINEGAEANPLVYLDLLKLFHTLSRRSDFDRYREEFNLQFTGVVPPYTAFLTEGNGLESYADICNQIVDLWPSDDAIGYIEMCMVRQPEDEPGQGFDLDAFRDLLMLHGVLRRLGTELDSAMVPFSASRMSSASRLGSLPDHDATAYDEQMDIATAPLPPIPHVQESGEGFVDLDITSPPSNLMDFDINGLSAKPKPETPGA